MRRLEKVVHTYTHTHTHIYTTGRGNNTSGSRAIAGSPNRDCFVHEKSRTDTMTMVINDDRRTDTHTQARIYITRLTRSACVRPVITTETSVVGETWLRTMVKTPGQTRAPHDGGGVFSFRNSFLIGRIKRDRYGAFIYTRPTNGRKLACISGCFSSISYPFIRTRTVTVFVHEILLIILLKHA